MDQSMCGRIAKPDSDYSYSHYKSPMFPFLKDEPLFVYLSESFCFSYGRLAYKTVEFRPSFYSFDHQRICVNITIKILLQLINLP